MVDNFIIRYPLLTSLEKFGKYAIPSGSFVRYGLFLALYIRPILGQLETYYQPRYPMFGSSHPAILNNTKNRFFLLGIPYI